MQRIEAVSYTHLDVYKRQHFGWQNKDEALYGLREGYKNSADELVEIAVNSGDVYKRQRLYQSITAVRYRNPRLIGIYVMSIDHA